MALPIFNEGIKLISLEVIAPFTYLESWDLVAFVITSKILLDFLLFLLEVIGVTPFLGTFEINVKTSSLWGCSMCAPF
jgi:hypothetical protein